MSEPVRPKLRRVRAEEFHAPRRDPVDDATLEQARAIVDDVRRRGEDAVVEHSVRLGDLTPGDNLVRTAKECEAALRILPAVERDLLERTAGRIRAFAEAQRESIREFTVDIPGGQAGQQLAPIERAGCYAPGGRFPLPSSVLMTAVTARAAGVERVWVASPRPTPVTLAAAAVAEADGVLAVGGAQAIAALAFGCGAAVPACDAIVGPGNRWVTAAKQLVAGRVAIDMLAGPTELVVLADDSADPAWVAADLIAQAEHDPDALPVLVTLAEGLVGRVEEELARQLEDLPTRETAAAALRNGVAVLARNADEAVRACNEAAPEHLQVLVEAPDEVAPRLRHYGALFVGQHAAEVLGDYGAGPNHVLPTGRTARWTGGLSVLHFLRARTWMVVDRPGEADELARDAAALARLEGLEGHARAAERRRR
jgi:phosphoribosyl-ATP pyrophosphohydrolase/phosphoribosyl-AMP cyclohydrolase/histidinol dehydrogenase